MTGSRHVLVAHPSADAYGSDRQLAESMIAFREAGWDVSLCLPADGPLTGIVDAKVRFVGFPVLRKALLRPHRLMLLVLGMPTAVLRLVRLIRELRPDLVYVNTVTIPWWIFAARLCRVRVFAHVHEAEDAAPRAVRIALNAPLLLADTVIANSRASRQVLVAAVPALARRTRVVPNGIPDNGAAPFSSARRGHLALVGRLSPRKGVDVALEAVALLRNAGRDVTLEICGTVFPGYEWFEKQLRDRARQPDLAGSVTFAGYVNPTLPVLARSEVVLVPSRTEPFGNTAVEALLAARPLVASDVQGLAEIVEHERTGLLVPPDDAAALAGAVARYLDDPEWARRVAAVGRSEALRRFGVDRYRTDIRQLIEPVA